LGPLTTGAGQFTGRDPNGVLDDYQPVKARRTGGRHVTVPLYLDLVAAIAAMPVIGTDTYLLTDHGKVCLRCGAVLSG
jgi:hypothetical protein